MESGSDRDIDKIYLEKSAKQIADEYTEDWHNDANVDALTLAQKLEDLSHISHKWAKRVFDQKLFILKLESIRDKIYERAINEKLENGNLIERDRLKKLNDKGMQAMVRNEKKVVVIEKQINQHKCLLEFLESIVGDAKYILPKTCEYSIELKKLEFMT